MSVEINTPHRDYPLPHQSNLLEQDVLRLIQALTQIDVDVDNQQQGLTQLQTMLEQQGKSGDANLAELKALLNQQQAAHHEHHRKQKLNHLLGETIYPL
ncbi:hypothetical protein HG263_02895 [Pseudoalteromonas sp. JBTF-M23]|uniref:Uncharacterized protein n=1 Tax=Pseudoalteromonas caenipelagi TaxID=2726988 RepID=A0A849V9B5_9GAMM|nr:hypothetical protein [Pseudoalteromonas caenipelagi]NOU49495.1 hypothetical protein [Pseudoalteromonas caenipelagi]